jgi:hypothetical protein
MANWTVNAYDSTDRIIKTSDWSNTNNRAYHQNLAQTSTSYPSLSGTYYTLTENFFDDYTWESRSDININQQFTSNFNYNNDLPVITTGTGATEDLEQLASRIVTRARIKSLVFIM